jgi:hypothetical protein
MSDETPDGDDLQGPGDPDMGPHRLDVCHADDVLVFPPGMVGDYQTEVRVKASVVAAILSGRQASPYARAPE